MVKLLHLMQKNENKKCQPRDLNPGPLAPKAGVLPTIPLCHKEKFAKKLRMTISNAKTFKKVLEGISNLEKFVNVNSPIGN